MDQEGAYIFSFQDQFMKYVDTSDGGEVNALDSH